MGANNINKVQTPRYTPISTTGVFIVAFKPEYNLPVIIDASEFLSLGSGDDSVKSVNGTLPDPITGDVIVAINNIGNTNLSLTSNRTLLGDNFTFTFSLMDGFKIENSIPVGIGDDPQDDTQLQLYAPSRQKALVAQTVVDGGKAISSIAGGVNSFAGQFTAQGMGSTGILVTGDAAALDCRGINGPSVMAYGPIMVQPYGGSDAVEASAILQANSTHHGFLPPRMTGAQGEAIVNPAEGLMIYATTGSGATINSKGWWGYNGGAWVKIN